MMVAATKNNQVFPMTERHHADARVESIRLRRTMGSSLITDSYGEARYFKSQTFFYYHRYNNFSGGWVHWKTHEGIFR